MQYPPNADAATFLVREIVPRLRSRIGADFEVRIVGAAPPDVVALASARNVVVTGYVEDLEAELAGADVAVVPLRHGTGTRLKILEAFAHQIPVVSTSVGTDGLAVENRRHFLLADDPTSFAEACHRLLGDECLRTSLANAAYKMVKEQHDRRVIEDQIATLAVATMRRAAA